MNEQQKNIVFPAITKVLFIVYATLLYVGAVKCITSRSLRNCLFELILVIAIPAVLFLLFSGRKKVDFPKTIAGRKVRPDATRKALNGRLRAYIRDSLTYAVVSAAFIAVSDVWQAFSEGRLAAFGAQGWLRETGSFLLYWVLFLISFLACDFLIYECIARRVREQRRRRKERTMAYQSMINGGDNNDAE